MVVTAAAEACYSLGFQLQSPVHMLEARLQELEQPGQRLSAVKLSVRRVHERFALDPCRHVYEVARVFARLCPENPCRRHFQVAEQMGGLQTGSHRELKRHGYVASRGGSGCARQYNGNDPLSIREFYTTGTW